MEEKMVVESIGERIRIWRKERGMKAKELAEKLEISNGSLSEIENGKTRPSALTLASIHLNTGMNVGYVLTGKMNRDKSIKNSPRVLMVEVDADIDLMIVKNKK